MNGSRYIDLLINVAIPAMKQSFPNDDYIFHDDACRIHRTSAVRKFVKKNIPERFEVSEQAVEMDDVWPIDNLWSIIRQELSKYESNSLHDMKQEIIDRWESFSEEKCRKMINSIPKKAEGNKKCTFV